MSKYFVEFPTTQYKFANSSFDVEKTISNITLKTQLLDSIDQDDPYLFLPYTVRETERAEDVSNFYYGSTGAVWLVYFANDIVDPYEGWVMENEDFRSFFRKKYSSMSGTTDPIEWAKNTLITTNIVHYECIANTDITISSDTYDLGTTFNDEFSAIEWSAVRYYDYENTLNEAKRNIVLLNESYLSAAENNLTRLMNDR